MEFMEFQMLEFNPHINITCRVGTKWYEKLTTGDVFEFGNAGLGVVIGQALCLGTVLLPRADDLPSMAALLRYEHDPGCRTVEGITQELEAIYGEATHEQPITLVVFTQI